MATHNILDAVSVFITEVAPQLKSTLQNPNIVQYKLLKMCADKTSSYAIINGGTWLTKMKHMGISTR
jgi:hypothetical protein